MNQLIYGLPTISVISYLDTIIVKSQQSQSGRRLVRTAYAVNSVDGPRQSFISCIISYCPDNEPERGPGGQAAIPGCAQLRPLNRGWGGTLGALGGGVGERPIHTVRRQGMEDHELFSNTLVMPFVPMQFVAELALPGRVWPAFDRRCLGTRNYSNTNTHNANTDLVYVRVRIFGETAPTWFPQLPSPKILFSR